MSTIDEIMSEAQVFASAWSLVGGRFDDGSGLEHAEECKAALRNLIAAALADAERKGAAQMQAAAAKLARKVPLHYGSGEPADEELAQAIEDLPLPTGERQAVMLTDEQMLSAGQPAYDDLMDHVYEHGTAAEGGRYHALKMMRAIEVAALEKNGLEVRCG